MWKRIGLLLGAVIAAFAVTGAGHHRPMTNGPESRAVAEAVDALTHAGVTSGSGPAATNTKSLTEIIPADFADVMGYQPKSVATENGHEMLIKPSGDCSAPGPDHLWASFESACQTHDLGYDLLRYAAQAGGELGPWARSAIDDQFSATVHSQCDEPAGREDLGCHALAGIATTAVSLNSWRQGDGVPVSEDGAPYAAAAAVIFLALAGPPLFAAARTRLSNSAALAKPVVMAK